jgi:hypothetical protein
MGEESSASLRELRTPHAAGIMGVLFAGLFAAAVVLDRIAAPGNPASERDDFSGAAPRLVLFSSHLIGFAGIFFLWFIGVVRSRLGRREDQFFSTVLFGSGIVFVASLYASVAVEVAGVAEVNRGRPEALESVRLAFDTSYLFAYVFAAKMAGAFMAVFTTMLIRLAQPGRWLTIFGYIGALMLLFTIPRVEWLLLVFPLWVLVLSIKILRGSLFKTQDAAPEHRRKPDSIVS